MRWEANNQVSKRVKVTRTDLVKELFSSNNDAFSAVGQVNQPNKKTAKVTSPRRPKKKMDQVKIRRS